MKKTTAYGRKLKLSQARQSPVGKAIAKTKQSEQQAADDAERIRLQAEKDQKIADMDEQMTTMCLQIYAKDDGSDDADFLAHLAWMLTVGAQIAVNLTPDGAEARRLHAALRTVVQMSVNGNRWDSRQAKVLHEAAMQAKDLVQTIPLDARHIVDSADFIAAQVLNGTARMSQVAGAEIYNQQAAMASGAQP